MTYTSSRLLRNLCFHCRDWAKNDIVHVLVRVPHEMKRIEEIVGALRLKVDSYLIFISKS